jgi:hypothetical protein
MKLNVHLFQGKADMLLFTGMQTLTAKKPGTSTSKVLCDGNFQIGIFSICCNFQTKHAEDATKI